MQHIKVIYLFVILTLVCPAALSMGVAWAENNPVQASWTEIVQASSLKEREAVVAAKEKELAVKEQKLAGLRTELDEKLAKLAEIQDKVEQRLTELNTVKGKRFKNLISVYSSMSASKVAPFLNGMEDDTVAEILRAMKTDLVAKIMPKLDPAKAVRVSKRMGLIK